MSIQRLKNNDIISSSGFIYRPNRFFVTSAKAMELSIHKSKEDMKREEEQDIEKSESDDKQPEIPTKRQLKFFNFNNGHEDRRTALGGKSFAA